MIRTASTRLRSIERGSAKVYDRETDVYLGEVVAFGPREWRLRDASGEELTHARHGFALSATSRDNAARMLRTEVRKRATKTYKENTMTERQRLRAIRVLAEAQLALAHGDTDLAHEQTVYRLQEALKRLGLETLEANESGQAASKRGQARLGLRARARQR